MPDGGSMHDQSTDDDNSDATNSAPPGARYVVTDDIPDGKILVPLDSDLGTVMLVRKGHMSEELAAEINAHLGWMTGLGFWTHR